MEWSQRMDGGLFQLQELALIISFACVFDSNKDCLTRAESKLSAASFHRTEEGGAGRDDDEDDEDDEDGGGKEELSLRDVLGVMRDHVAHLMSMDENSSSSSSSSSSAPVINIEKDLDRKFKTLLTEWSAALATLIN